MFRNLAGHVSSTRVLSDEIYILSCNAGVRNGVVQEAGAVIAGP